MEYATLMVADAETLALDAGPSARSAEPALNKGGRGSDCL